MKSPLRVLAADELQAVVLNESRAERQTVYCLPCHGLQVGIVVVRQVCQHRFTAVMRRKLRTARTALLNAGNSYHVGLCIYLLCYCYCYYLYLLLNIFPM